MYKIVTDIWYLTSGTVDSKQHFEEVFETKEDAKEQLWYHNDYETNNASTIAIEEEDCFIAIHLNYCASRLEEYVSYITRCAIKQCYVDVSGNVPSIRKIDDPSEWKPFHKEEN